MDSTSEHSTVPEYTSPASGVNPLNLGFALVVVFALGLALGFFGRPAIINDVPVQVVVTVVPNKNNQSLTQAPVPAAGSKNNTDALTPAAPEEPSTTQATTQDNSSATAQATPTLMEFVMADARHIQGDTNAPVTIVEFSDFK